MDFTLTMLVYHARLGATVDAQKKIRWGIPPPPVDPKEKH